MNANRSVGFNESINLFFINYTNFSGRSSTGAYWWYVLWALLIGAGALIIDVGIFNIDLGDPDAIRPISTLTELVLLIPGFALSVRRLHDINKSGWWLLIVLTIVGILLLIYWYIQPGTSGPNNFGPDVEAGRPQPE